MGILSFIQLLGIEKAAAAVLFGFLALKNSGESKESAYAGGRKTAKAGIILGFIYAAVLVYFLIRFSPRLFSL